MTRPPPPGSVEGAGGVAGGVKRRPGEGRRQKPMKAQHHAVLISCPDCGNQISSAAVACPHCGSPRHPIVTESTGKMWKAMQLVGGIAVIWSFVVIVTTPAGDLSVATSFAAFLGLLAFVVGRIGGWWFHG